MASSEYQGWPPRVVRGSALQAVIASSENQTVKLPRCRKLASYAGQFVTLRCWRGIRWRRSWLSLKGTIGIHGQERAKGVLSYATPLLSTNRLIPAPRWRASEKLAEAARPLPVREAAGDPTGDPAEHGQEHTRDRRRGVPDAGRQGDAAGERSGPHRVQAKAGPEGLHPEDQRQAASSGHPDCHGPRNAGCRQAGAG